MRLTEAEAIYSELPGFSGDGYSYGGGAVVTIGNKSLVLGVGDEAYQLAHELVRRWNEGRAALAQSVEKK